MKKPVSHKLIAILAGAFVVLSVCCILGAHLMTDPPFAGERVFDGASGVFAGKSGRVYVIDEGKKSILILNQDGELEREINGGTDSDDNFYYASRVAEGSDGSIFLAEVRYSGQGTLISQERIFKYNENGGNRELLYTIDYEGADSVPYQYGNIQSLYEKDGELVFSVKVEGGLDVCTLDLASGTVGMVRYSPDGDWFISDSDVDPVTMLPVFTDRLGRVCAMDKNSNVNVLVDRGESAWTLTSDGVSIYYTDLATNSTIRLDPKTGEETAVIIGDSMVYSASVADGSIYSTDNFGYYVYNGESTEYVYSVPLSAPVLRSVLWVAAAIAALLLIAILYLALIRPNIGVKKSATFQRVIIVLIVSICIGGIVTFIITGEMINGQNETVMDQLNLYADILIQSTDVESLERVDSVDDYRNEDYLKVKATLDDFMDMSYDNSMAYYYIVYTTDGEMIYVVMDYEDTSLARHPLYPYGTESYTDVFTDAVTLEVSADVSSYGSWSFVLKPIQNAAGETVGIMEVGSNLDSRNAQNNAVIWQVMFTVLSVSVVLLMIIIETIFYMEHREKKLSLGDACPIGYRFPIRTIVFITFMADCMQDAFVSIIANQLYTPLLGIPQSVGAALPLSAQVLAAALSAFVFGALVKRAGVKKILMSGFACQIAGFIMCGAIGSYMGLLIGKVVIGLGMGAIIVCMNSISASGESEVENARSFTAVNSGTLAGITVGAGIGSVILSFADYKMVYFAGAAMLLLGMVLSITGSDFKERVHATVQEKKVGTLSFIADRKVWSFLLLLLMPFLIAISFREYFFPLFAEQEGITSTDIGRIYLVCGLIVIYVGPFLTRTLIHKLGGKGTVVTASVLMVISTILFSVFPTMVAAIAGLILLSLSISFGYSAQSTYFSGIPKVEEYGEGRAMGVYSLFDNGGQTLGPMVYGLALLTGYRSGLLIIGVGLAALILVFAAVNGLGRSKDTNKNIEGEVKNA